MNEGRNRIVPEPPFDVWVWSRRDSNPRPNEEAIRFLHVYLRLNFRAPTRPKPPIGTLFSLFRTRPETCHMLFPIFPHHYTEPLRNKSIRVMSRRHTSCGNEANLLYFD